MFRIQPGITEEPVQRTFENIKFALNSTLLTFHTTHLVDSIIGAQELAVPFKIPYFIDPKSLETTPMWKKGAMSVDVTALAQNTGFTISVLGGRFGQVVTDVLFTQSYSLPAGSRLLYHFNDFVSEVDLTPYDSLIISPEVAGAPAAADRYVITTQLTFRPFEPFGVP